MNFFFNPKHRQCEFFFRPGTRIFKTLFYLQQKAVEEEQAKAQTAAIAMQFLTDKLHKEEKAVRLNETKLITKWRDILRNSKSEELKKDIQILSQTFERMVDKKNALVEALVYSALKFNLK